MPPYQDNSSGINSDPNTTGEFKNTNRKKPLLITVGILAAVLLIVFAVYLSLFSGGQDKNTKAATDAARKATPNAEVSNLKVADGFAIATVSDPTAKGQAISGYSTVFKVNNDGSMTQLAKGSDFNPINLLELGIPLATQAKLSGRNLAQVQQDLTSSCGYNGGNSPGYYGFHASFKPDGWQIDATTFDGLEKALTSTISKKNAAAKEGEKIVCINAIREKSGYTTNMKTYTRTFALGLQFITGNGTATDHKFTFAIGPSTYRSYTLDGHKI
ncbi:MAG TPA: hypothetical protein VFW52_03020 [Candidatus Saccharimonadales bacterium]|nr:hypothetical protein [Candidatus Saccharimonadales bacterium]